MTTEAPQHKRRTRSIFNGAASLLDISSSSSSKPSSSSSSFIQKTLSRLHHHRHKHSPSTPAAGRASVDTNPYRNGGGRGKSAFMSQPMLSLAIEEGDGSSSSDTMLTGLPAGAARPVVPGERDGRTTNAERERASDPPPPRTTTHTHTPSSRSPPSSFPIASSSTTTTAPPSSFPVTTRTTPTITTITPTPTPTPAVIPTTPPPTAIPTTPPPASLETIVRMLDGLPPTSNEPSKRTEGLPAINTKTPPTTPRPATAPRRLGSLPRFAFDSSSARLSPSFITHAPMPLLNLPTLTPSTSAHRRPATSSGASWSGRRGSLSRGEARAMRAVPALPRQGTIDAEDGDHSEDESGSDDDEGFHDAVEHNLVESPIEESPPTTPHDYFSYEGQATRSMVDILSGDAAITRREPSLPPTPSSPHPTPFIPRTPYSHPPPPRIQPPPRRESTLTLSRRRSLPTFTAPGSPPPPYPSFAPIWRPAEDDDDAIQEVPREPSTSPPHPYTHTGDGSERLPPYTNAIYLRSSMPRKMEFTAPGVQARDRKWRRVLVELEGTVLRVYQDPVNMSWWERRVGVGDVSTPSTVPVVTTRVSTTNVPAEQPRERDAEPKSGEVSGAGQTELRVPVTPSVQSSPPHTRSFLGRITGRGHSSTHSISAPPTATPPNEAWVRDHSHLPFFAPPTPSKSPRTSIGSAALPTPPQSSPPPLLRSYGLSNAESGLGNDYIKRRNVIRIRMEGEQFLLQCNEVGGREGVVGWVEALHAAANVALDLDERVMPRGPLFPRRRRRRRTNINVNVNATSINTTS